MKPKINNNIARWVVLALIVILQIVVLIISPEEKTLGAGIKPVYLHVSLTWVGMILALVCALIGLGLAISGHERLANLQRRVFFLMIRKNVFMVPLAWLVYSSINLVNFTTFGSGFATSSSSPVSGCSASFAGSTIAGAGGTASGVGGVSGVPASGVFFS